MAYCNRLFWIVDVPRPGHAIHFVTYMGFLFGASQKVQLLKGYIS